MSNSSKSSSSINCSGFGMAMLTGLFVILKVLNLIDWSWAWVFAPLWMPTILVIFILIIFLAVSIWANN